MKLYQKYLVVFTALFTFCGFQSAKAVSLNIDEILAPGDVDAGELSAEVYASITQTGVDSWSLELEVRNTSSDAAGSGAGILLTGVGFVLPGHTTILGGSATIGSGSSAVGFTDTLGGDVSQEWGYDANPLDSGALQNTIEPVNTAVSSMESQTTTQFTDGTIADPVNLDGPDFGLVSADETDGLGEGVEAINDSIVITLLLQSDKDLSDLATTIDNAWVAVTFGSPGNGTSVPDAGSSLMLLGVALLGLTWAGRRAE